MAVVVIDSCVVGACGRVMGCEVTMHRRRRVVLVAAMHVLGRKRRPGRDVRGQDRHEADSSDPHQRPLYGARDRRRQIRNA